MIEIIKNVISYDNVDSDVDFTVMDLVVASLISTKAINSDKGSKFIYGFPFSKYGASGLPQQRVCFLLRSTIKLYIKGLFP